MAMKRHRTPVQTGLRENGWVEIAAPDLKAGDTVVTVGAYGLPEKTKIRIQNSSGDEPLPTNSPERKMKPDGTSPIGGFATRHALSITFIAAALVPGGNFFRAAHAVVGVSADGFSARRHHCEQRHHARR